MGSDEDEGGPDPDFSVSNENDGRSVEIDTGFYRVEVSGDTQDSFEDVVATAMQVADRAKEDAAELDDRIEDDGRHYR